MMLFGVLAVLIACCGAWNGAALARSGWRWRIRGWRSAVVGGLVMVVLFLSAALFLLALLLGWRP